MPRPPQCRWVSHLPAVTYFKPRGIPLAALDEVRLAVDELEALRLADLEGMYQEKGAEQMKISRPTFGRILDSAHRKVAEALVEGKALRIEGGEYAMNNMRTFVCADCENRWQVPFGTGRPGECPACGSRSFRRSPEECGRGRGSGRGQGGGPDCRRGRRGARWGQQGPPRRVAPGSPAPAAAPAPAKSAEE